MHKPTFIEEARRNQIVIAAIETIADIGYGKTSMSQIAKRARISPSLIAYHFANKHDLIEHTLDYIVTTWERYVAEQVTTGQTAREQLRLYIVASLTYMGTRPRHFAAMIEIVFNARSEAGVPLYQTDSEKEPDLLETLLTRGQASGEFRPFNVRNMATAIRGAISEFYGAQHNAEMQVESYMVDLVDLFLQTTEKRQPLP